MKINQHTISKSVSISGVGLHTGVYSTMTFKPAKPNSGIRFQRIDLPERPIIEADADLVVDCSRGTTLEKEGGRVHTVEHTLAALVGLEIDNVLIEIDGPEPPILDGSAIQFIEMLEDAGLEKQNLPRNFYEIESGVFYNDAPNKIELAALPLDDYRLTVMVDYNTSVLGSQHASLNDFSQFKQEIAPCRTFCFLHEVEMLHKNNLIKGGDLNNAIVIVDKVLPQEEMDSIAQLFGMDKVEVQEEGILNNLKLHFKNEPARHKLLDLVGDLALVGRPIKGQILAARPGHASNVAFARRIKRKMQQASRSRAPKYDPTATPVLDINQLMEVLPHRYPFLLVDKIMYLDENSVIGVKNVTLNEPYFQGHFPGNPVMPGVLQIEAMAQTGGILVLNTVDNPKDYWSYFIGIDQCRFKRPVLPGDTIVFRCELTEPIKRGIARMKGQAFVAGNLVSEATMSASIIPKNKASK
ncbi:MAG: bifunctional UDP-3-O-[3-hydroxymyristoyl] N-acetylglucosamine deacetylase/3-hydroxyacyl-ACP dehydratase [Bernardetiaceae bacterium]|nr:bifunctional UDP-3-O-[3-hydroxymyristoyl] N-acetylglucosamine deacetylase/3-hydroxyacyl-ACP dehydratase [Bernardetiaceae bacterium]